MSADTELLKWLESRRSAYLAGHSSTPAERQSLEALLPTCSLSAEALLEIGRAFAFLEGDDLAACWYRAGIAAGETQYRGIKAGEASAQTLLHLLDQTKALWRLKDYPALEKRFALAMRLNPPLSAEARRAGYLHADVLYYQRRYDEAANAILAVQAQHEQAGDLGRLEKSDLSEMHWTQGLFLYYARARGCIPHLEACAQMPGPHAKTATHLLVRSLATAKRGAEARKWLEEFVRRYKPAASEVVNLFTLVDECERPVRSE